MSSIAYLNGEFLPLQQARISPLDRGFLFGDSVYELIPCYNGMPFRAAQHVARLLRSLESIYLPSTFTSEQWQALLNKVIAHNPQPHQTLYLQVSRGQEDQREQSIKADTQPTVFIMSTPMNVPATEQILQDSGIHCITTTDTRWQHCDIKANALLANILLRHQASLLNADEAILIRDHHVTEGSASNVFVVHEGELATPPLSQYLLGGVTRDLILELAKKHPIKVLERPITHNELRQASEIWITSSSQGIRPVVKLDKSPVGNGLPGSMWRTIAQDFADYRLALLQ